MEENHLLIRPLLNSTNTTTNAATSAPPVDDHVINNLKLISSNSGIIFRLSLVVFIGMVALWANHEASKGYAVIVVNESGNTFPGTQFQLLFVSNDEATRILIKASKVIENFLYPDTNVPAKPIGRVILRFAGQNLTDNVIVELGTNHEFRLNINPSIVQGKEFDHHLILAIRKGVARIWLWDGQGKAPQNLIDGIVEYLANYINGGSTGQVPKDEAAMLEPATACWKQRDPRVVAEFFDHCERHRAGFVRRLNQAMKDGWDDEKLGGALGRPVRDVCTEFETLRYNLFSV